MKNPDQMSERELREELKDLRRLFMCACMSQPSGILRITGWAQQDFSWDLELLREQEFESDCLLFNVRKPT